MVIFHRYVSLPEGHRFCTMVQVAYGESAHFAGTGEHTESRTRPEQLSEGAWPADFEHSIIGYRWIDLVVKF